MFGRRKKRDEPAATDAAESADQAEAAGVDAAGSDAAGSDAAGSDAAGSDAAGSDAAGSDAAEEPRAAAKSDRSDGPWDVSEVDLDAEDQRGRIDIGGLLVRGADGMQLQLQVEEESQQVAAALVVVDDSAVQLLAVAAPRSSGVWDETRAEMSRDARRRGATVEEAVGPFGPELRMLLPVQMPDGQQGVQPSRVVGVDGPRWLLRATFLGRATAEDPAFARLAEVVRDTVVVRGDAPMAPGDLLPLRLPEQVAEPSPTDETRPSLDDLDPGPTITELR